MNDAEKLLVSVLRDLMNAEADYRSAMHIYKDMPGHWTRIRAECSWHHAKTTAKCVLRKYDRKRSVV